jgi:hypothetical protein
LADQVGELIVEKNCYARELSQWKACDEYRIIEGEWEFEMVSGADGSKDVNHLTFHGNSIRCEPNQLL